MWSKIIYRKQEDKQYPHFEIELLGSGRYRLRLYDLSSSSSDDISYARTLPGARWKARRIFRKMDRFKKSYFKNADYSVTSGRSGMKKEASRV